MTQKNRQPQLFTAKVDFDGEVCFNNGVVFNPGGGALGFTPFFATPVSFGKIIAQTAAGQVTADSDDAAHSNIIIGISLGDVGVGLHGIIKNPVWSFPIGVPLYVSPSGDPTATVPTTGFQLKIGVSIGIDKVALNIATSVILAP